MDRADRLLQRGVGAAGLDRDVDPPLAGGALDLVGGIAGPRVQGRVGAAAQRQLPSVGQRVHGEHRLRAAEAGHLQDEQADGPHAEHGHPVAEAHAGVAHRGEGKVRGVEEHRLLRAHARGQVMKAVFPRPAVDRQHRRLDALGIDGVGLPDPQVAVDPVAHGKPHDVATRLRDLAHGHVAHQARKERALFPRGQEHAVLGVKGALGERGVAPEGVALGAVLGRRKKGADADLVDPEGRLRVLPEHGLSRGDCDKLSGHRVLLVR